MQELPASSPEYSSLRKIVQNSKSKNKREVLRKIGIHLGTFTEGVLQNIIADVINGRM